MEGNVKAVNVYDCVFDDPAQEGPFRNSVEKAVYKASPLPSAPDAEVFDAEILFNFYTN